MLSYQYVKLQLFPSVNPSLTVQSGILSSTGLLAVVRFLTYKLHCKASPCKTAQNLPTSRDKYTTFSDYDIAFIIISNYNGLSVVSPENFVVRNK